MLFLDKGDTVPRVCVFDVNETLLDMGRVRQRIGAGPAALGRTAGTAYQLNHYGSRW